MIPTRGLIAVLFALLIAPKAMAADEVAAAFGNTVKMVDARGRTTIAYLDPDGKYRALNPDGTVAAGHWFVDKTGAVCIELDLDGTPVSACGQSFANRRVGDRWSYTDENSNTVRVSVEAGRKTADPIPVPKELPGDPISRGKKN